MNIFVCALRIDLKKAKYLVALLTAAIPGSRIFSPRATLNERDWNLTLDVLERIDIFVYALSPASINSTVCQVLCDYALGLNKPILSVLLEDTRLPDRLVHLQYADLRKIESQAAAVNLTRGLSYLRKAIGEGEYQRPAQPPPRPSLPELRILQTDEGALLRSARQIPLPALSQLQSQAEEIENLSPSEQVSLVYQLKEWYYGGSPQKSNAAARTLKALAADPHLREELQADLNAMTRLPPSAIRARRRLYSRLFFVLYWVGMIPATYIALLVSGDKDPLGLRFWLTCGGYLLFGFSIPAYGLRRLFRSLDRRV